MSKMNGRSWSTRYRGPEGDPLPAGTLPTGAPPAPPAPPTPPAPPAEKTFKQTDVEKMVQERLKKANEDKEALLLKLQDAAKTVVEKEAIQAQLDEVRTQLKSKEELHADAVKRAKAEREGEIQAQREEAKKYRHLYERDSILRSLSDAAVKHQAHRPAQLVDMLVPKARVTDKLDKDGKPTGEFETRVKISVLSAKDKKMVDLDLTPDEAVEAMKKDPDNHGNLFTSTMVGGMGAAGPRPSGANRTMTDLPQKDFNEAYRAARAAKGK